MWTQFQKISHLFLKLLGNIKKKWEIFSNICGLNRISQILQDVIYRVKTWGVPMTAPPVPSALWFPWRKKCSQISRTSPLNSDLSTHHLNVVSIQFSIRLHALDSIYFLSFFSDPYSPNHLFYFITTTLIYRRRADKLN